MRRIHLVHLAFAGVLAFGALPANAQRMPVPIVNVENVAVEGVAGKPVSAEQVKKAIEAGAVATGRKWEVTDAGSGRLLATYRVRTHTVVTEIRYSEANFSVAYKDSVNMKYTPSAAGPGLIHPFYNQWVQEFVRAIRAELGRT